MAGKKTVFKYSVIGLLAVVAGLGGTWLLGNYASEASDTDMQLLGENSLERLQFVGEDLAARDQAAYEEMMTDARTLISEKNDYVANCMREYIKDRIASTGDSLAPLALSDQAELDCIRQFNQQRQETSE